MTHPTDIARLRAVIGEARARLQFRYDVLSPDVVKTLADAAESLLTELETTRAQVAGMRTALEAIEQRANERYGGGAVAERETVYAMHAIAKAALSPTPAEKA